MNLYRITYSTYDVSVANNRSADSHQEATKTVAASNPDKALTKLRQVLVDPNSNLNEGNCLRVWSAPSQPDKRVIKHISQVLSVTDLGPIDIFAV